MDIINNLPIELISKIFSYIKFKKCYRCNHVLLPSSKYYICYNNIFCSNYCIEYQH